MPHLAQPPTKSGFLSTIRQSELITSEESDAALHKVAMDRGLRQFLDNREHGDPSDKTSDMFDHIIGEIKSERRFPSLPGLRRRNGIISRHAQ